MNLMLTIRTGNGSQIFLTFRPKKESSVCLIIRALYDRSIVAYKTGASQTVNLVLDTIHLAMKSVKTESRRELHLHSGQRFQYTSQAYFDLTKKCGTLLRLCRDLETAMTMLWLKISLVSSKQSVSIGISLILLKKQKR